MGIQFPSRRNILAFTIILSTLAAPAAVLLDAPGHAAAEGAVVNASGGEPGAAWALIDWRGRDTGISGVFDAAGRAEIPPMPAGYYRMVAVEEAGQQPEPHTFATLAVVAPVCRNPAGGGGSFYGADCAADELYRNFDCPWNGGDAVRTLADLAALAGFAHVRGRHNWSRMQPSADALDCAGLVDNAALFSERGIGVSGLIYGTPAWAGRLKNLPADLVAVYRSCRDIGEAFGDTIEDWEFFNEPDIGFTEEPVWDYVAAMKAAYLGFKAAAPQRPFLCGGLCQSVAGAYASGFFDNDAASYFDVFNYHTYEAVSGYSGLVAEIRGALEKAGAADRPIWFTECGTNHEGPASANSVRKGFKAHSPEQEIVAAEFFPKSQVALQMAGVARNFAFILGAYNERDGAKDWGMLRRDGTVKPVYAAFSTIAHELGDATIAGALDVGKGLRAYLFDHPDGTQTVAFWSESPIDTATSGQMVVRPEPDLARTMRLAVPVFSTQSRRDAEGEQRLRLVDMCGGVSAVAPGASGALALTATRFPAYLSGLRGLAAMEKAHPRPCFAPATSFVGAAPSAPSPATAPAAGFAPATSFVGAAPSAPSPVVLRVDLDPGDFEISNNKTMAMAKGDKPRLRVQAWNLSDTAKTGLVEAHGIQLDGLPKEPVEIAPFGKVEFDCTMGTPAEGGEPATANASASLTLRFAGNGEFSSRLTIPVFFENLFMASCESVPLNWKDPAAWIRNDSAADYSIAWDEAEQALRFDVAWKDPGVGRWFYPVLPLPADGPNLVGATRVTFEVKSAQDKMENDFGGRSYLMLVRKGKGGSSDEWLQYAPPIGTWERRYVELATAKDLQEVDAIRLGANPRGMRLTFWVRGIAVLKAGKADAAPAKVLLDAPGHAAAEGTVVNASGGEPGAAWRLIDWRGRDTGISGVFDAAGRAEIPPMPAGYYRLCGDSKRTTASLATLAVIGAGDVFASAGGAAPRRSFYGVDCGISELSREFDCPWNGGDAVRTVADLAALAGFGHVRERMRWSAMQKSPDLPPDATRHAANAALFKERGIKVSIPFIGTPKWASPMRTLPGDLAALFRSTRDMAAAYGDSVEDWEFWNEPDIHFALEPVWDFAAAMKVAYLGFKAARPEMPVACAGLCQPPAGVYASALLANGVAPYFDIFNYHTYAAISHYPSFFADMRDALSKAGKPDCPIWMTESGTNLEGPATLESVRKGFKAHSPEQELVVAEFAPKSQIAMQMEGVARDYFFILGAYSERDGAKDWGMLRRDGTVKPVYAALSTIAHELGDATIAGALDVGKGLRAYLFDHPDGTQTVAFWSESPIDTATSGQMVVRPEPDLARTMRLAVPEFSTQSRRDAEGEQRLRLVDMCGGVSAVAPGASGALALTATRFPAYLSGLRGLAAKGKALPRPCFAGAASFAPATSFVGAAPSAPSPVVLRVDLNPGDFDISNRKTLAVAKGNAPRLRVQVWNFRDTAVTGTVTASGAALTGLPEGPVEVPPYTGGHAEFDCVLRPSAQDGEQASANASTLALRFAEDGDHPESILSMPVLFEQLFLASCETMPLDWKDPAKWLRNDSAADYSVAWDEGEQALRFDVEWKDPHVGRWFYPVLPLELPAESLAGAVRATFEVKTAQDKVENDFGESCLMLARGGSNSPADWLQYSPPTGSWERRYVELAGSGDISDVDAIRIGANPRGMRLTFWVRNISILKPSK